MATLEEWLNSKYDEADNKLFDKDGFMVTPKNWNRNAYIHNEMNNIKDGLRAAWRLLRFFVFGIME